MRLRETLVVAGRGAALAPACGTAQAPSPADGLRRYQEDLDLLKANVKVVELSDEEGRARVAVVPAYQGRVMTSTAGGPDGFSLGWINEELDRLLGDPGAHEPLRRRGPLLVRARGRAVRRLLREGRPLRPRALADPGGRRHRALRPPGGQQDPGRLPADGLPDQLLGLHLRPPGRPHRPAARARRGRVAPSASSLPEGVDVVAFESENRVTNTGSEPWTRETGLLSIWILGMFPPSDGATVVIPFVPGPEEELGPVVNDAYFGKVPADRLVVEDERLFFRADGRYRSKIGIPPRRATPVMRQLRPRAPSPDPGPADAPHGGPRLRQLDVGAPGRALRRRRGQLLQRRPPGAGGEAARALLRARVVVAGPGAGARRVAGARPPDRPPPGQRRGPGPHRPRRARRGDRRDPGEAHSSGSVTWRRTDQPIVPRGATCAAAGNAAWASSAPPGSRAGQRGGSRGGRRSRVRRGGAPAPAAP